MNIRITEKQITKLKRADSIKAVRHSKTLMKVPTINLILKIKVLSHRGAIFKTKKLLCVKPVKYENETVID